MQTIYVIFKLKFIFISLNKHIYYNMAMRRGATRRSAKRRLTKRKTQRKRKSGGGLIKTIKAKLQKRKEKKAQKIADEIAEVKRYEEAERQRIIKSNAREESRNYSRGLSSQANINASRGMDDYDYLMSGRERVYDD
jgi:hypothetical protein